MFIATRDYLLIGAALGLHEGRREPLMDKKLVGSISYFVFAVSFMFSFFFVLPYLSIVKVSVFPFDAETNAFLFLFFAGMALYSAVVYSQARKASKEVK